MAPKLTPTARRSIAMMLGGIAGAHVAGAVMAGIGYLMEGPEGLFSCVLGFVSVMLFFSIGQAIEILACELEPMTGLGLVMVSYAVRAVGLGVGTWFLLSNPQVGANTILDWVALATVGCVVGWLAGVILVASRQRVPTYDKPYQPPNSG